MQMYMYDIYLYTLVCVCISDHVEGVERLPPPAIPEGGECYIYV